MQEAPAGATRADGATPTAPTPADAPPAKSPNMVEVRLAQLERLASLRDAGALSDAEYEAEKVKVLSGN